MTTCREEDEFERRVREAEEAGMPNARETLAIATGRSQGCTEGAPDVTLAEALDKRPTLAERVRATNSPHVRLVEETDEQAATVIFFGLAAEPEESADT